MTIISYLKDQIMLYIDNYNINISEDNLKNYLSSFRNTTTPLSTLFETYLQADLDNFKNGVFEYVKHCYNTLYDDMEAHLLTLLTTIENKIKAGTQQEINDIVNESKTTVLNLINKQNQNLTDLIDNAKTFINNAVNSINGLKSYQKIPIDYYYRVKEIFKRIDVLIDTYQSTLISSIDAEYLQLQIYVNDKIYLGEIDAYIDKVEIVWDIFHNNEILNETVTFDHATDIIEKLGKVRSRYLEIKEKLLNAVKQTYDDLKNNELKKSVSNVENLKKDLNARENAFIDLIAKKVLYITNYESYNEDIKKVVEVENKISEIRINGYNEYIFEKIDKISVDDFLSSSRLSSIKSSIENEVGNLLTNLKNKNTKYKTNYQNILSKFENLLSSSQMDEYIKNIKEKVGSSDVLTYLNDYYSNLNNKVISQYKAVTDNIINNKLKDYVNSPDELVSKIKSIANNENLDSNVNDLNNKISSLINDKMANILNEIISRLFNFIETQVNYIRTSIPNSYLTKTDIIIETGKFYSSSNELKETLKNNISVHLASLKSSVNIKSNIEEKENSFNSNIIKLADEIEEKCKSLSFIYGSMDNYDKYFFTLSKFRDALNHLTLLQPYINDVINNNLNGLSSNDFLNLYKNPNNFDVNTINGKVKELLYDLIIQGIEKTQPNVDSLKKLIKEEFSTNFVNISEAVFPYFFRTLFNRNDYLDEKLNELLINISRVVRNRTTEDANSLIKDEFYFNGSKENIEVEFNKTIDEYLIILKEEQEKIKKSLVLPNKFKNKIVTEFKAKLEKDFKSYYEELKNMFSARTAKNCILLDNQRTLLDILEEAKEEIQNDDGSNIGVESLFSGLLKSFRDEIIDEYFDYFNNNFKSKYRYYFDIIRNHLLLKTSVISNKKAVNSIPDNTTLGFKEGLQKALSELKNLVNLEEMVNYKKNEKQIDEFLQFLLNKFSFKMNDDIKNKLDLSIDLLKATCDKELIKEKDSFKEGLLDYFEVGFNLTVKTFINGPGISYLNGKFTDDYINKIVPKLNYILSQCKEINDYLYLILDKILFDVDDYITDSVGEVFYQLMNYINDGISQDKVSAKILKKLHDFKYDSAKKIVNYFKEYTLGILTSISFKNSLSSQVKQLIPTNIPLTTLLNFTNFYYEILDSAYLKKIHNTYSTKINKMRENIIEEVEKFRMGRKIQIGELGQGFVSSDIATPTVEYNKLNASLSQINNDFSFKLSDSKKRNAYNLLASSELKQFLANILKLYYEEFEYVQNKIKSNVFLQVDINTFSKNVKKIFESLDSKLDVNEIIKDREAFMNNFTIKFNNLEEWVFNSYKKQVSPNTSLKSIENRRRLDIDINIENIQHHIDIIDYKMKNLTLNIFNSEKLIELQSTINQITSDINVQLILLDNHLESYIKYADLYLTKENLNPYRNNATSIYNIVENILNEYLKKQSDIFNKILIILDEYSEKFNEDVKPKLIEAINNVVKKSSFTLISKYLNNSTSNKEEKVLNFEKKTNLTNLNGLTGVLGTTRLNFSTNIQNIIFKYGHNFVIDQNNYKVYLNILAGGYVDGYIIYHNNYYNTSVAGAFADGKIGINLTNDYLNEIVNAVYYTEYKNCSLEKYLYELTTLDSWGVCEDAVDCFVGPNDDYCPYIVRVQDEEKTIIKPEKFDSDFYKNESIYIFNGYYENKLCTFANYFFSVEEKSFEYGSELKMTV